MTHRYRSWGRRLDALRTPTSDGTSPWNRSLLGRGAMPDKTRGMLTLARAAERSKAIRREIGAGMNVWDEELKALQNERESSSANGEITAGEGDEAGTRDSAEE